MYIEVSNTDSQKNRYVSIYKVISKFLLLFFFCSLFLVTVNNKVINAAVQPYNKAESVNTDKSTESGNKQNGNEEKYNKQNEDEKTDDNEKDSSSYIDEYIKKYDFSDIDSQLKENSSIGVNFKELIMDIIENKKNDNKGLIYSFFSICTDFIRTNKNAVMQIVLLAIISALINGFSPSYNKNQISDTARMIISVSLIAILLAAFAYSCKICSDAVRCCIEMYKSIIPVFFSAVTFAQGNITSGAYYEVVLLMITIINMMFGSVLIYLDKVYVLFKMSDSITGEEHFSKAAELIPLIVKWACRLSLIAFSGIAGVKSLIVPVSETMKKNLLYKSLQAIPGIGGSVEAVTKTIAGAGIIIKNAIGTGAIIIIFIVCAVPVIKLAVLTILYKVTAAAIEPVADKRIVEAVNDISTAIGLLAQIVLITMSLFVLMSAIICISTNYNFIS